MRQNVGRDSAAGVADAYFDAIREADLGGGNRDAPTVGCRFGRVDQQIHQHLRELIGVNQNVGQVFGNLVLRPFAAERRLAFEKAESIGNQAMQAEVAQHQRTRTGVIDESA